MKNFSLLIASGLLYLSSCNNADVNNGNDSASNNTIPILSYSIAATYPHDTSYFTEGLEFYKGKLLESTGNYGKSKLIEIELQTGKPIKGISI